MTNPGAKRRAPHATRPRAKRPRPDTKPRCARLAPTASLTRAKRPSLGSHEFATRAPPPAGHQAAPLPAHALDPVDPDELREALDSGLAACHAADADCMHAAAAAATQ
jgi:hypothetical protein